MKKIKNIWVDTGGDAIVVEATILFPIIFMAFFALVFLSMYLPQRAILQEAAQHAATMLVPERSDTVYWYDDVRMKIPDYWDYELHNSLSSIFTGTYNVNNNFWVHTFSWFRNENDWNERAKRIVDNYLSSAVTFTNMRYVQTETEFRRSMLHSEFTVTVSQEIPMPINLSFIGFPSSIYVERTATVIIPDGDGFLRSVDDAMYFAGLYGRATDISVDIQFGLKYLLPFLE